MVGPYNPLETWTIQKILSWSQAYLEKLKVSDSPRLDAEVLLGHALTCDRMALYLNLGKEVLEGERGRYRELLRRRGLGEPVAYIIGFKDFWKHRFIVDSNVLIPRADTETLVEKALELLGATRLPHPVRILDIGTGSGCIALSLKLEGGDAFEVSAWDISEKALELAKRNEASLAQGRGISPIRWQGCDARQKLKNLPEELGESAFHVIVSNPPYISPKEVGDLAASVIDFEPHLALFAEEDGLEFYKTLAQNASSWLVPGGVLMVEVGSSQSSEVQKLFELENVGWIFGGTFRDLAKKDRVLWFCRGPMEGSDSLGSKALEIFSRWRSKTPHSQETLAYQPLASRQSEKNAESEDPRSLLKDASSTRPSAFLSKVELYYEEEKLSVDEEELLKRYGTEDSRDEEFSPP